MKIDEIAKCLGARILSKGRLDRRISKIYAGDRISDLLNACTPETLIVTNLSGMQLVRLVELMDIPAVCVTENREIEKETISKADSLCATILVSPAGMFETCGRIFKCMTEHAKCR